MVAILVRTVAYAVIGFIAGAIIAVIYNLAARIFGGLEIDFAESVAMPGESGEEPDRRYE